MNFLLYNIRQQIVKFKLNFNNGFYPVKLCNRFFFGSPIQDFYRVPSEYLGSVLDFFVLLYLIISAKHVMLRKEHDDLDSKKYTCVHCSVHIVYVFALTY